MQKNQKTKSNYTMQRDSHGFAIETCGCLFVTLQESSMNFPVACAKAQANARTIAASRPCGNSPAGSAIKRIVRCESIF